MLASVGNDNKKFRVLPWLAIIRRSHLFGERWIEQFRLQDGFCRVDVPGPMTPRIVRSRIELRGTKTRCVLDRVSGGVSSQAQAIDQRSVVGRHALQLFAVAQRQVQPQARPSAGGW
jgi:hypothetical protein